MTRKSAPATMNSMNNVASFNPSIEAENAQCQEPQDRWTPAAWALGIALLKGPVRGRNGRVSDRLVRDLIRRGVVAASRNGWMRITDRGRIEFPRKPCVDTWTAFWDRCTGPVMSARWLGCDARPAAWISQLNANNPCQ